MQLVAAGQNAHARGNNCGWSSAVTGGSLKHYRHRPTLTTGGGGAKAWDGHPMVQVVLAAVVRVLITQAMAQANTGGAGGGSNFGWHVWHASGGSGIVVTQI